MSAFPTDDVSAKTIGERIEHLREIRGLTRQELAKRSGISRTTMLRIERGLPTHEGTLAKVAKGLQLNKRHLLLPEEEWNRPYQVHLIDDNQWYGTAKLKERPGQAETVLQDSDERNRLGHLGYFGAFVRPISIAHFDANLGVGVAELYANHYKLMRHPGLEFMYVMRGEVVVTIQEDEVHLKEGESITFWGSVPHNYRPATPVGRHEEPPQVLMAVLEGAAAPVTLPSGPAK